MSCYFCNNKSNKYFTYNAILLHGTEDKKFANDLSVIKFDKEICVYCVVILRGMKGEVYRIADELAYEQIKRVKKAIEEKIRKENDVQEN